MKTSLTGILRALPELKYPSPSYVSSYYPHFNVFITLRIIYNQSIHLFVDLQVPFTSSGESESRAMFHLFVAISPMPGEVPECIHWVSCKYSLNKKKMTLKIWGPCISTQYGSQEVEREGDILIFLGLNPQIYVQGNMPSLKHSKQEPWSCTVTD